MCIRDSSTGAELLAKQGTRERMMRLGINPADPNAVAALADAEQGQLDAAQAYREAQAERGTLFGELPRAAILEEQVRQREGRQLEARREADRIASLTPEHEALRMAQFASTPSNVRKTGREDFEAMADVHSQLAKGFDVPQIEDAVRAVDKARGVNIGQAIAKLRNGVPLNEDEIKALQNPILDLPEEPDGNEGNQYDQSAIGPKCRVGPDIFDDPFPKKISKNDQIVRQYQKLL